MINVLVNGCNGRMGQEVVKQIELHPEFNISCGVDKFDNNLNNFNVYSNINEIIDPVDIIIDFSVPESTFNILEFAKKIHKPIVIATTGFTSEQEKQLLEISKSIPIFKSSNMSFDINLMCKVLEYIAPLLSNTDIEIQEVHHNRKLDAPSGTAITLANTINNALGNTLTYNFNRFGIRKKRDKKEIGFSSIRGGNIVGEHTVQFFGENETFEIKHTSYSRTVFAEGALKACQFMINKPNGFYTMDDLMKNNNCM